MRNLALSVVRFAVLPALLGAFAACSAADAVGAQDRSLQAPERPSLLRLYAEDTLGHKLELLTTPGEFDRASARLTIGERSWQVSDDDCTAFKQAIAAYQALPPLRPGPGLLLPEGFRTDNLPSYRPHGARWTIQTQLYAPDGSAVTVVMEGGNGPHPHWMTDTVIAIKSCGPPSLIE